MGYPDGYYYGQGRIICDTSTFSVGDTIRVRSMTDSSKVWNQQVATVGTALVFTVPCYDYYKICTVQTINDTPTEIGGVYRTVDYGQTLFINVIDKFSIRGAKSIVNAHQQSDIYSVGDEITVNIGGTDYPFVVAHINRYNTNDIVFTSKYAIGGLSYYANAVNVQYPDSILKSNVDAIGNAMSQEDYDLIEPMNRSSHSNYGSGSNVYVNYQAKIWVPALAELVGLYPAGTPTYTPLQFDLFTTAGERILFDSQGGSPIVYWTSDGFGSSSDNQYYYIGTDGINYAKNGINTTSAIRPCFILVADS